MRSPNFLAAYAKYTLSYLIPPNNILLNTAVPLFIVLHLVALHRYFIFYKLKVCDNLVSRKCTGIIFPNSFWRLLVSVSYFSNPLNISNIFIIILFIMVICNQ